MCIVLVLKTKPFLSSIIENLKLWSPLKQSIVLRCNASHLSLSRRLCDIYWFAKIKSLYPTPKFFLAKSCNWPPLSVKRWRTTAKWRNKCNYYSTHDQNLDLLHKFWFPSYWLSSTKTFGWLCQNMGSSLVSGGCGWDYEWLLLTLVHH